MFLFYLINSKSKSITFAAFLLSISAFISRLLGILRDNLLANLLPKTQTDIYYAAFRIPDFLYGIFITGGIIAAFLPVFSVYFKKSKKEAQILTNSIFTFFLLALIFLSFLLAIVAPFLVDLIVPGFSQWQKTQTVILTRIMFLSPILLGVSAIFSGILQYFNLFFAYSLAPIFYNIGIIFGILVFRPFLGISGLAWGVILGAFFYLILQIFPVLKSGFPVHFSLNFQHPGLKKIFKLMIPRSLAALAYQINFIVITSIASTLASGSIRIFNFANNIQGFPIGLIGISFASAAFPVLSRHFANRKKEKFFKNFSSVFSQILFLIIPLSILTFLLRTQIVQVVLGTSFWGRGFFDWEDARLTSACLGIFSFSLFAATLIPFLTRAFFALQDAKTPVKIVVFSMVLNIIFSFYFVSLLKSSNLFQLTIMKFLKLEGVKEIALVGLPLAVSLTALLQFFLLFFCLKRKIADFNFKNLSQSLIKILIICLLMSFFTYFVLQLLSLVLDTQKILGIFLQGSIAGMSGFLFYLLLSFLLKLSEPKLIFSSFLTQFK